MLLDIFVIYVIVGCILTFSNLWGLGDIFTDNYHNAFMVTLFIFLWIIPYGAFVVLWILDVTGIRKL